jgi:hypothetical protein
LCAVRARVGKQIHGSPSHQRTVGTDLARQQF